MILWPPSPDVPVVVCLRLNENETTQINDESNWHCWMKLAAVFGSNKGKSVSHPINDGCV